MYPVVDGDRLWGCVSTREIKNLPRDEWRNQSVGSIATRCGPDTTVAPDADVLKALAVMNRTGSSRVLVVDGDRLVGILSLKDLLGLLAVKLELEAA
jgi:CBS domain-containing protein